MFCWRMVEAGDEAGDLLCVDWPSWRMTPISSPSVYRIRYSLVSSMSFAFWLITLRSWESNDIGGAWMADDRGLRA